MSATAPFSTLIAIAERAVEAYDAEALRMAAKANLNAAYVAWKKKNKVARVEKDTLDWLRMMGATKPAYQRLELAKREERNARRRLATAVNRYRKGGEA